MDNQIFIKRVWMPDGTIVSANLVYRDRPVLILESGEEIVDDKSEIKYEMTHELIVNERSETIQVPIPKQVRVYMTPRFTAIKKYTKDAKEDELDIYPPSTNGFYGRLVRGKSDSKYYVQKIVDDNRFWLTVIDCETNQIHESHTVHRYEIDVIRLKTFYEQFDDLALAFSPRNPSRIIDDTIGILDNESLEWNEVFRLTGGIVDPAFKRGLTAREILVQLAPIEEYPEDTRDEILAFLAWVAKDRVPKNNVIEFLDLLHVVPLFRDLYGRHLHFKMDNLPIPPYLQFMKDAVSTNTENKQTDIDERARWSSDNIFRRRIQNQSPDWQGEIANIVQSMNKSGRIITTLPTTKSDSTAIAQRNRLIMYEMGLRIRASIRPGAIGLKEIVYIGAAHRWPHLHLSFSYRLGPSNIRSPYIQNMIMPPSAAEKVKRALPSILEIEWSARTHNANLYSTQKKSWTIRDNKILSAFNKSSSLRRLQTEFGYWKESEPYQLTPEEIKIIDMACTMFYLSDLDSEAGRKYWMTDEEHSKRVLTTLVDRNIIDISYWFKRPPTLSLLYIALNGSENQVCSVTRALLNSAPTTLAMVANKGRTSLVLTRVPEQDISSLLALLETSAKDSDMSINCIRPSVFRNYTTDFYRRLYNDDGKWIDDVGGLLAQIRSKSKVGNDVSELH